MFTLLGVYFLPALLKRGTRDKVFDHISIRRISACINHPCHERGNRSPRHWSPVSDYRVKRVTDIFPSHLRRVDAGNRAAISLVTDWDRLYANFSFFRIMSHCTVACILFLLFGKKGDRYETGFWKYVNSLEHRIECKIAIANWT